MLKAGIVWRRATPTLYIQDPDKKEKLAAIRDALAGNSIAHPVFYQDEVDIHLNPKIGADWRHRGKQRKVATPGQNKKHYLAGALHGQTGQIVYVGGERKTSDLFIALLEKLKGQYRRAKSIQLVVDNYIIHKSKKTQKWLNDNPESSVQKHGLFTGAGLLLYGHCRTVSGRQTWFKAGVSQLGSAI